jgi:hypothetical protein
MPYACATLPCMCFRQVPDPNPAFRNTYIQYNFKTMTVDDLRPPTFDRLRPLSVEAHTISYVVFLLQSIDTNRTLSKQDAARLLQMVSCSGMLCCALKVHPRSFSTPSNVWSEWHYSCHTTDTIRMSLGHKYKIMGV